MWSGLVSETSTNKLIWVQGDYGYADTPESIFYHDLEPTAQKKAIAALKHQSARVFTDTVTYEPWHDIETMYFFCDADQALPLAAQQGMAALLGPDATSIHLRGSHSPFLSQPQEVVNGLEQAVKTSLEKTALV